jgi:hypothetical protein
VVSAPSGDYIKQMIVGERKILNGVLKKRTRITQGALLVFFHRHFAIISPLISKTENTRTQK